uniref:Uncharacterized protein n=1 Tax=Chromera velia CCMP2878 TaxID=1169474 RepID=A0A0G4HNY9_9ALVE|eukprot:Cvel_29731.t1-p1 / transcript=Cvel_29731.t1 / gene=Cvel_29731 / organism=Chromera_velia_CCMP2878 / gene_product=hypothetical protein / transcript_product=hypothetical protein / location=Cvel_scaffold4125:6409-8421(-) / protein_length=671 / sequence_SO=supercontig / SO=protein_coding / is_pseudo=false
MDFNQVFSSSHPLPAAPSSSSSSLFTPSDPIRKRLCSQREGQDLKCTQPDPATNPNTSLDVSLQQAGLISTPISVPLHFYSKENGELNHDPLFEGPRVRRMRIFHDQPLPGGDGIRRLSDLHTQKPPQPPFPLFEDVYHHPLMTPGPSIALAGVSGSSTASSPQETPPAPDLFQSSQDTTDPQNQAARGLFKGQRSPPPMSSPFGPAAAMQGQGGSSGAVFVDSSQPTSSSSRMKRQLSSSSGAKERVAGDRDTIEIDTALLRQSKTKPSVDLHSGRVQYGRGLPATCFSSGSPPFSLHSNSSSSGSSPTSSSPSTRTVKKRRGQTLSPEERARIQNVCRQRDEENWGDSSRFLFFPASSSPNCVQIQKEREEMEEEVGEREATAHEHEGNQQLMLYKSPHRFPVFDDLMKHLRYNPEEWKRMARQLTGILSSSSSSRGKGGLPQFSNSNCPPSWLDPRLLQIIPCLSGSSGEDKGRGKDKEEPESEESCTSVPSASWDTSMLHGAAGPSGGARVRPPFSSEMEIEGEGGGGYEGTGGTTGVYEGDEEMGVGGVGMEDAGDSSSVPGCSTFTWGLGVSTGGGVGESAAAAVAGGGENHGVSSTFPPSWNEKQKKRGEGRESTGEERGSLKKEKRETEPGGGFTRWYEPGETGGRVELLPDDFIVEEEMVDC